MPILLQDIIVTLVAAVAAVILVYRVLEIARPVRGQAGCSTCGSNKGACAHPAAPGGEAARPVVFLRSKS